MRRPGLYLVIVILFAAAMSFAADANSTRDKRHSRLLIQSGTLFSKDGAPIQLRSFEAEIADGDGKTPEHLGNKIVLIRAGNAFLSNDALGRLLTDKLKGHNLEDITVTNDKGKVKITGKAKKVVSVPFTIEGPVSLTDKGFIRLEMATMKVAHLPKGVAELLGLDPEKMAGDGSVKGVSMDKNAISFDPDLLWGLPVHGQVTRIALEKNGLRLIFSQQKKRATQLRAGR